MDRTLTRFLNGLIVSLTGFRPVGRYFHQLFARVLPVRRVRVRGVTILVATPPHQVGTYLEASSWGIREPEVLDWIDGFKPDSVFFDVGANFGTETLYAALKPGGPARIAAFDVESLASFNLALNLRLNNVTKVDNHLLAVGDRTGLARMEENLNYLHVADLPKYATAAKTVMQMSLDDFSAATGLVPDHVKIDVDGPELAILEGMKGLIGGATLKSVMIEINSEEAGRVTAEVFTKAGFVARAHGHKNAHNVVYERSL